MEHMHSNLETDAKQGIVLEPATSSDIESLGVSKVDPPGSTCSLRVDVLDQPCNTCTPTTAIEVTNPAYDQVYDQTSGRVPFGHWVLAGYQRRFTGKAGELTKYLSISLLMIIGGLLSRAMLLSLFKTIVYSVPDEPGTMDFFIVMTTADALVSLGIPGLVFFFRRWLSNPSLLAVVIGALNLAVSALNGYFGFHYFGNFDSISFIIWLLKALLVYAIYYAVGWLTRSTTLRHIAFPVVLLATAGYVYILYSLIYSESSFGITLPESSNGTAPINAASKRIREWQLERTRQIGSGRGRGMAIDPVACDCLRFIREHFQLLAWAACTIFSFFVQWGTNQALFVKEDVAYSVAEHKLVLVVKWCVVFQLGHTLVVIGTALATTRNHHRIMCQLTGDIGLSDIIALAIRSSKDPSSLKME